MISERLTAAFCQHRVPFSCVVGRADAATLLTWHVNRQGIGEHLQHETQCLCVTDKACSSFQTVVQQRMRDVIPVHQNVIGAPFARLSELWRATYRCAQARSNVNRLSDIQRLAEL